MIPGPFRIVTTTTLSSAGEFSFTDFSGIPANSRHLVILLSAKTTSGVAQSYFQFNGDTAANYSYERLRGSGGGLSGFFQFNSTAGYAPEVPGVGAAGLGGGMVIIPHYKSSYKKTWIFTGSSIDGNGLVCATWNNTAAITRVDLGFFNSGATLFESGAVCMLGVIDETYLLDEEERASSGTIVLSAAGTEEDLVAIGYLRGSGGTTDAEVFMNINGDTGASYFGQHLYAYNSTLDANRNTTASASKRQICSMLAGGGPADVFAPIVAFIQQSSNGSNYPKWVTHGGYINGTTAGFVMIFSGYRNSTAAITSVEFASGSSGSMATGSLGSLYKLPKNRILNHELSSSSNSIGGSVTTGGAKVLGISSYLRTSYGANHSTSMWKINNDHTMANFEMQRLYGDITVAAASYYNGDGTIAVQPAAYDTANRFGGGAHLMFEPEKTDRYKFIISSEGMWEWVQVIGTRWKNNSAVTSIGATTNIFGVDYGQLVVGSQFQVESISTEAATVTSGFFFRFMSIAAPTVGLAAASSYLSWLTNAST